ncbi:MAG: UvrD-helicase domain-containing protein, partial [Paludibacteraceae bacterium]|nr:UvrD-helicase domain-containing protein [Paludibacteraceae bacterium]
MDKPRNILDELNESQRNAVLFTDGPELVIAGAGSGKTRMLTYKIAYLLYKGIPADRILALTFTNKAAKEMRERISAMVGWNMSKRLWMGTFHSIFGRILRAEADRIGFTPQFTIYDTSDSKSIIKNIIKEMELDDKKYKVAAIQNRISTAKNNLITAEAYASDPAFAQDDYLHQMPKLSEIFLRYSDRCKSSNAMDFDDMLLYMNILVRDNADILSKYQDFFQYILVDEYQDTNFAQYLIIKKLAEKHNRLCVVGDDAQSIYSFRGANIDNILKFKDQQPNCKLFKLERNYRSTQNIVDAANSLIIKNKGQIRKNVYSEGEVGEKIHVKSLYSDLEEGDYIAKEVQSTQKSGCEWKDIAVLYRTNAQSRVIEEAFRKKAVPYKIYGGLSFYQRKEVKDALCYMRLVLNEDDEEAMRRIINVPARGIGETTVNKVLANAHSNQISAWKIVRNPAEHQLDVNKGTAKKLMEFAQLIEPFRAEVESADAYTLAQSIIKASGLREDAMRENSQEGITRKENIDELLKAINEFCEQRMEESGEETKLSDFMSEVALATDQDEKNKEDGNAVNMMTVHAAKGLEFDHIYIVGLEEQLFPSIMAETTREIEEERRLLYVAITRARKTCHISYARQRWRNGKTNLTNPSRFLKDIDKKYLDEDVTESTP